MNTEPLPGSLVTVTSPPIMRASLRVMARPNPVPPNFCAVVASAWLNSSNSLGLLLRRHADAGVGHRKLDPVAAVPLRALSVTSPSLVNLQALLKRLSRICRSRMGIDRQRCRGFPAVSTTSRLLVLLGELTGGADHLVDERRKLNRLRIELEFAGLDLGEVKHLID